MKMGNISFFQLNGKHLVLIILGAKEIKILVDVDVKKKVISDFAT